MTEQEEINLCLNCQLPECVNCLSKGGRLYFKHEELKKKIREYSKLGFSDRQMAILCGCHPNTIAKFRGILGIPQVRGGVRVGRPRKAERVQDSVRQHVG